MKRVLAVLLILGMVCSVTACGNSGAKDSGSDTPAEVLTKVWDLYEKEEKFTALGGDPANSMQDKPGKFDLADRESLDVQLGFPQASVALIDDAASLVHVIGNIFTAGAYHVEDASEIELLTADLQDNILSRQWLDAIPDKIFIVSVGKNIVVSVFGKAELVDTFKEKLFSVYEEVKVYAEENI